MQVLARGKNNNLVVNLFCFVVFVCLAKDGQETADHISAELSNLKCAQITLFVSRFNQV